MKEQADDLVNLLHEFDGDRNTEFIKKYPDIWNDVYDIMEDSRYHRAMKNIVKEGYSEALSDLQGKVDSLIEAFETAANQLEGVSIAIAIHGQNINTDFFINTYKISADNARDAIAEFKNGGLK